MSEEKLLTVRDVSLILGISEKEVLDLAESARLPAYKVGGVYLRFKKEQIHEFQKHARTLHPKKEAGSKYSFNDKVKDFFYFNDFYILTILVVGLLLMIILRGY